jgi:hypothetical protein
MYCWIKDNEVDGNAKSVHQSDIGKNTSDEIMSISILDPISPIHKSEVWTLESAQWSGKTSEIVLDCSETPLLFPMSRDSHKQWFLLSNIGG